MIAPHLGKELINRIINDDVAAYKQLFLNYHKPLIQFSSTITRSKEVVSHLFLKIWIGRKKELKQISLTHIFKKETIQESLKALRVSLPFPFIIKDQEIKIIH